VYRNGPPTPVYAFIAALTGGTLMAQGQLIGGGVLVALAIVLGIGWQLSLRDGDDHSGLY
jgi:hypothetical protein